MRTPRIHVPGGFYHVTLRGNHQHRIFVNDGDQRLLNLIVRRALVAYDTRLHAYCWMSNHIHLLMQVDRQPLGHPMRCIASEFARAMQAKMGTTGHFFERRYYASLVETDSYLFEVVRYIHLNPVRAGVSERADDFAWSSHHAYVGRRRDPWVTTDFVLGQLASDRAEARRVYRDLVSSPDALEWEPEPCPKGAAKSFRDELAPREIAHGGHARVTIDALIDEACRRFDVTRERLESPIRDRYMSRVRAWIGREAMSRHVCGLTAVARALNRDESTLREAVRAYREEREI